MKVKGIVATALLLGGTFALSQDYPLGARAQAMGGSGVAFAAEPEAQLLNPALLAELDKWGATVFYSHPFGMREIVLSSLCLRGQLGKIAGGAALVRLGHENFEDRCYQLSLAHAFSFRKKTSPQTQPPARISFGLLAAWREIQISNYGQTRAFLAGLGCVARLGGHFVWGAKLGNLLHAKMGAAREPLPREMSVGFGYFPRAGAVFQFDVYKESAFPLEVRGGIEYRVVSPLSLRLGISSNPDRLTCGMALWLRQVCLHITVFSHADLGWTQQYAVTLQK